MEKSEIQKFLPQGINPRPQQEEVFSFVKENLGKKRFILVEAPTGTGKSIMAYLVSQFANSMNKDSAITVHRKSLQDQYANEFKYIPMFKGMAEYPCSSMGNCKTTKKHKGKICGDCNWLAAKDRADKAMTAIYNLYSYYHSDHFKNVLIADEAHNVLKFLAEMARITISHSRVPFSEDIEDPKVLTLWLKRLHNELAMLANKETIRLGEVSDFPVDLQEMSEEDIDKLTMNVNFLSQNYPENPNNYLIKVVTEERNGKTIKNLNICPKTLASAGPLLWPEPVETVVLLSATFNEIDLRVLGIKEEETAILRCDSPIPPERRPFRFIPVCNMSNKTKYESLPILVAAIQKIMDKYPGKSGVIHTTYPISKDLQRTMTGNPRLIFHYPENAKAKLDLFLKSKGNVLVACGMEEGLDLKDDLATFQIITNVQFPFFGDPMWEWKAKNADEEYVWEAIRKVIQQSGRNARHEKDFGITYLLDSQGDRIFSSKYRHLWPKWFLAAAAKTSLEKI